MIRRNEPTVRARLVETPPVEVAQVVRARGLDPEDALLCTRTDIDLAGKYRDHWLLVTPEKLLVVADGAEPSVVRDINRNEALEYRAQSGVGSGLLQARLNGHFIDLLRYSNRAAFRFEKVARKLDRQLRGESIVIHEEDEVDPRRCRKCGLTLEFAAGADQTCPQCVSRGAVLLRMMRLMRPYRNAALMMMALLVVGIGLDLVSPQLTKHLVDNVLQLETGRAAARPEAQHAALITVVLILALVQTSRMVVNFFNGRLGTSIGTSITHDMRSRLVGHMQQLSIGFYDKQQVGSLVGRVAYDTESLHGFINQLTSGFLLQVLMLIGVGIMMFTIDVQLALWTLVPAPLVVGGTMFFWKYIYPRYYRSWDAASKQSGLLSGLLSGVRVVKAFSQEERELSRFNAASRRITETRKGVDYAMFAFNPAMGIVFQLGGWIVWYVGGRDVIDGRLSLGELMAFFGYLWMFYGPLGTLPQFTSWLTSFATQAHRIFEILDTPVQIAPPENPVHMPHFDGRVTFDHVAFGYDRHNPVLRDLSLDIKPGEMIGIVGHSGSGKTSLVNLICRFYDVSEGAVRIDDVDVRDIPKDELRKQVGVVLQEPFLFRGSIWENIAYGIGSPELRPNHADSRRSAERIIVASKAGNCHDFILHHPHAYDTWVGERGSGLSGGEKQRIGIARVLLTDPRILILDEATSSVDAESEAAIQAALAEVVRERTTIAIAHRLSTLRSADRIIVLDNGRLIEQGSHEELMMKDGQYARMVRAQGLDGGGEDRGEGASPRRIDHATGGSSSKARRQAAHHHPRYLTPETAHIHLGSHDALHVTVVDERIYGGVFAVRCFPVHMPEEYISLRYCDSEGHEREIGLVRSLADWPSEQRRLVEDSLNKRYFVHTIEAIESIEVVNSYLHFDVDTNLGRQRFTLRWQNDSAQDYGSHGKLLLDTDENRYLIPDVSALPDRDRRLFERFIYW